MPVASEIDYPSCSTSRGGTYAKGMTPTTTTTSPHPPRSLPRSSGGKRFRPARTDATLLVPRSRTKRSANPRAVGRKHVERNRLADRTPLSPAPTRQEFRGPPERKETSPPTPISEHLAGIHVRHVSISSPNVRTCALAGVPPRRAPEWAGTDNGDVELLRHAFVLLLG